MSAPAISGGENSLSIAWLLPDHLPDDSEFAVTAGRIMDLCQCRWDGEWSHSGGMIISADDKTSIQA